MLSDELRRRLEALNRAPLPAVAKNVEAAARPFVAPIRAYHAATAVPRPYLLDCFVRQLLPHNGDPSQPTDELGEQHITSSGKHALVRRRLAHFWPTGAARIEERLALLSCSHRANKHPELAALASHLPTSSVLLDLETCGFAGSMVFLVGLLWRADDGVVIDQLLARNYAEEQSILEALWHVASEKQVLVTFNGKSFDWPMVLDRTTRYRPRCAADMLQAHLAQSVSPRVHCDLLHHARCRWRNVLPNCKLQTLERYICGRSRSDDIPGSAIPLAYHHYVRTGETRELRSILHHNALDLVTLLEIALELLREPEELRQVT